MPLTDLQCLNAKPKDKKYKLTDEQGLYLVIMPNGKRYWRFQYQIHGIGKAVSFGKYPVVSLSEAREKRFAAQKQIEKGTDPLLARAEEKQLAAYNAVNTFELIAREWYRRNKQQWAERHAVCILYRLEKYIFPKIGRLPITQIKPKLLLNCLDKINPDTARRLLQYCSRIFRYAKITERTDNNPADGVVDELNKPKHGHVASIDIDEMPAFLEAIEKVRFNVRRQTYLAMRLKTRY